MSNTFSKLSPTAASFLAVAKRQTEIEKKMAGLNVLDDSTTRKRARLEKQFIDGEIKPVELSKAEHDALMVAEIKTHIGDLLDTLRELPPAEDGKRFHVQIAPEKYGHNVVVTCRYSVKPLPRTPIYQGHITPVFQITVSPRAFRGIDEKISWHVYDYTRLEKSKLHWRAPATPHAQFFNTQALLSYLARSIARMAPARIQEIAHNLDEATPTRLKKPISPVAAPTLIRKPQR